MKELIRTLNLKLSDGLIHQLIQAGYAFAAWRLPGDSDINLAISLQEVKQLEDFQLSTCDPGFLMNAYDDHHPVKPYHIPADILLQADKTQIDPKVKGDDIDLLMERLADTESSSRELSKSSTPQASNGRNEFEEVVAEAIQQIKSGIFEKVVLSRYREESLPEDFSPWKFFLNVCEEYPRAFCSLTFVPEKGLWLGATPELLLSNTATSFRTVALAGTKALEPNQTLGEIAWTQKEIEEQALVSRYIINCFKRIRLREFHEHGPKTVQAGTLAHLKTEFVVHYDEVHFDELANQMVNLLHPTSAVCGMPIERVKPWIKEVESHEREFYAGFLGPVQLEDRTDIFVNLRCMKIDKGIIRFYAGAGITEDSNPEKEYDETEMKMNILKGLL